MLDETDPTTAEGDESPEAEASRPVSLVEEALRASGEEASDEQPAQATEAAAPTKKAAAKRPAAKRAPRKTAAVKAAEAAAVAQAADAESGEPEETPPAKKAAAKKTTTRKAAVKKAATRTRATTRRTTKDADAEPDQTPAVVVEPDDETGLAPAPEESGPDESEEVVPTRSTAVLFQAPERVDPELPLADVNGDDEEEAEPSEDSDEAAKDAEDEKPRKSDKAEKAEKSGKKSGGKGKKSGKKKAKDGEEPADADGEAHETPSGAAAEAEAEAGAATDENADDSDDAGGRRRGRRRGGRRRRRSGSGEGSEGSDRGEASEAEDSGAGSSAAEAGASGDPEGDTSDGQADGSSTGSRRRRRRRRSGSGSGSGGGSGGTSDATDDRSPEDQITSLHGSTRLEAKKQRRREGREAGRRRAPIVSEAEFLARRESVERVMAIRQRDDLTQIAVLEDKVLVEHYVARESQTSLIGNVYLGRVQNVLPSMEAAFIDIGKGRNAVLYAGEVNWKALGAVDNQPRKIESVLKSGQTVLVQVSKDPIGHKGARLTSQISLPGRFLVYVPDGTTSGISRKLPEGERNRLKTLLKQIVPASAGVIVRTAAEGASEEELTQDVERLTARWADIEAKVASGRAPALLYGEPDLTLKVVRDLFTEDFTRLVVQGDAAWDLVDEYVGHVAPDLRERLERFTVNGDGAGEDPENGSQQSSSTRGGGDLFASYRIDEQIAKGLDRKVWLPSGGSLIIDRTEAMTVVDVNTGKFTGSGGNLEETVTKNNLEAAEEIVRQLRLRDIGGIIVVDFIDMVLESNRDLVLRRMVECLGRDRTRHQVAEVTSLGLVQMTRKRIGTGLLEAFSEECGHCKGRGLTLHDHPIEPSSRRLEEDEPRRGGSRRGRGRGQGNGGPTGNGNGGNGGNGNGDHGRGGQAPAHHHRPTPAEFAAMARSEASDKSAGPAEPVVEPVADEELVDVEVTEVAEVAEVEVDEATEQVVVEPVAEPVVESVPEPEPVVEPSAPAAPAAPAVVTSTRRRTARRAAGPPVRIEAPEAAVPPAPEAPADQGHDDLGHDDQGHDEADVSGEVELESEEQPDGSVLHVPVKRKGVRKR